MSIDYEVLRQKRVGMTADIERAISETLTTVKAVERTENRLEVTDDFGTVFTVIVSIKRGSR